MVSKTIEIIENTLFYKVFILKLVQKRNYQHTLIFIITIVCTIIIKQ